MTAVLDASAILAWLQDEPGADAVCEELHDSVVSAVNWSEVLQKARQHGRDPGAAGALMRAHGVVVVPADESDAEMAAALWDRRQQTSLADRFCLALGMRLGIPILTADRRWADIKAPVTVRVIR